MITDRMLRDTQRTVRLPVIYSRLCLVWMFYFQALSVVFLWDTWPDGFGSQKLNWVIEQFASPRNIGWMSLFLLGILFVALYAIRERRLRSNMAWMLTGVAYLILAQVGDLMIAVSEPEEPSLPSAHQFIYVGVVVALDIIAFICIRRFIRSRGADADATAN